MTLKKFQKIFKPYAPGILTFKAYCQRLDESGGIVEHSTTAAPVGRAAREKEVLTTNSSRCWHCFIKKSEVCLWKTIEVVVYVIRVLEFDSPK